MTNLAVEFELEDPEIGTQKRRGNAYELRLLEGTEGEIYVFYRNQLFAQYQDNDNYSRNLMLVQLFLCQKVQQKELSKVFKLTVPYISSLVGKYRQSGSAGLEDNVQIRVNNNQKIKGKIAETIIEQLDIRKVDRPTYETVAKLVKRKHGVTISWNRIGNWWREHKAKKREEEKAQAEPQQQTLIGTLEQETPVVGGETQTTEGNDENINDALAEEQWQANNVAGSFLLYAMLEKSQFLKPFMKRLKRIPKTGRKCVERVMLTLFFMHALRLKSIEQSKHLLAAHFAPLVLGDFSRVQNLRHAIDEIAEQKQFDQAVTEHYQNMGKQTELGDELYYVDGHFSCYYGKYAIPKGYDARRQRAARGRNTIYLHNSLGHNIYSWESPTNTTLNVDITKLLDKMKEIYGEVRGKTLCFDRGGFSAKCFKAIKAKEMYFTTYLKHRKKGSEVEERLFEEITIEVAGKKITNKVYEKKRETKSYGQLRTIIFIGKKGKQIPVISTNPTLSAAEIVARLQKRWVEENGFKYMGEHYNIDLLTTYKTEEAPDKILERANPERKAINSEIAQKQAELKGLKEKYTIRLREVKNKEAVTIRAFEEKEHKLNTDIKLKELEIGLLKQKRQDTPSKVTSNLKDESVIGRQKRRMLINLVKTMNYNCEKWLQQLFIQYHPKEDETLSLIRHVLKQPGRIRQRGEIFEVELERLDSEVQAKGLARVLKNLNEHNYLRLPDGRKLAIWQAD